MIRRPPRSTLRPSSAASDVYKRQVGAQSTRQGYIKANSTPDNQTGLYQGQFYARQPDRVISGPVLRQTDLHSHLILHNNDDVAKGQRILLVHANSLHRNPRCKNARVQSRDMLQLTPQSTLQGRSRCTYIQQIR